MATLKNTSVNTASGVLLPAGTTAQRPGATAGRMRIDTTKGGLLENFNGAGWRNNADWVINRTFRTAPSFTPRVLIQVESAGSNNSAPGFRQFIQINGTTVLDATAPRSYRLTKLRLVNGFWTYVESNGYDVFGDQTAANNAQAYLEGFANGEMLILNTWDEPNNRRTQLMPALRDRFGSTLEAYRSFWAFRDSHLLISIRGENRPLFEEHRTTSIPGINVSMWLP